MKRFLVAMAALYACAIACDDGPQSHVYVAMLYESAGDCLDPSTTLATIDTSDGSLECAPTCLVETAPPAVGAERVYVSTMCGPYPPNLDVSQTDPGCAPALAAYAAGSVCGQAASGDDGGAGEAGDDGGASDDGGGADAAGDDAPAASDASDASDAGDTGAVTDANPE